MVKLETVHSANSALLSSQPLVAVITAGTTGIGDYAVRALFAAAATAQGKQTGGQGLRVYIVARSQQKADVLFKDLRKQCPSAELHFVQAKDLALLSCVDSVCAEIIRLEEAAGSAGNGPPRIDILIMGQGPVLFLPRNETTEGIDTFMSLLFYSRARTISNLLPLLLHSTLPTGSHILFIYGAGLGRPNVHFDDLSLRKPANYSLFNLQNHVVLMTTVYFERMADHYKGKLSFVHWYPGLVKGPAFSRPELPWWFRLIWPIVGPILFALGGTDPEEAGARAVFCATESYPAAGTGAEGKVQRAIATNGVTGGGAYALGASNDVVVNEKFYLQKGKEETGRVVWEHIMKVMRAIDEGRKFDG